jgi:UDPglucose--hexose-1-phosphate uridylyltransferase
MHSSHDTPHLHHDPLTARTVFTAPGRAQRPNELEGATIRCPFCVGNESLTPPALLRSPRSTDEPWRARIVPNRFPIVTETAAGPPCEAGEISQTAAETSTQRPAHGVHEVVIESPAHVRSILAIDPADWRDVWELCRERLASLADQSGLAWATVFKNSGARAGASLEHVHSQLVALDFVPPAILSELAVAGRTADPFGDLLRQAAIDDRIVEETGDLVAVVPPAPRQPFETWILPRTAERYFHATTSDRVAALAVLTQSLIGRLDRLLPQADYNWWLHQPPYGHAVATHLGAPVPARWHWHLEIMPRINGLAGFELGAGCHITTATPQDSARQLREA